MQEQKLPALVFSLQQWRKNMKADARIVQTKQGKWAPGKNQLCAFEKKPHLLKSKNIRVVPVQTGTQPLL